MGNFALVALVASFALCAATLANAATFDELVAKVKPETGDTLAPVVEKLLAVGMDARYVAAHSRHNRHSVAYAIVALKRLSDDPDFRASLRGRGNFYHSYLAKMFDACRDLRKSISKAELRSMPVDSDDAKKLVLIYHSCKVLLFDENFMMDFAAVADETFGIQYELPNSLSFLKNRLEMPYERARENGWEIQVSDLRVKVKMYINDMVNAEEYYSTRSDLRVDSFVNAFEWLEGDCRRFDEFRRFLWLIDQGMRPHLKQNHTNLLLITRACSELNQLDPVAMANEWSSTLPQDSVKQSIGRWFRF